MSRLQLRASKRLAPGLYVTTSVPLRTSAAGPALAALALLLALLVGLGLGWWMGLQ